MQTITYRMDTQQGPLYSTANYIKYPVINHKEKEYICIIESLCFIKEINITLSINYISITFQKREAAQWAEFYLSRSTEANIAQRQVTP